MRPTCNAAGWLLLQAFWFYRPTEVPDTAWGNLKRMRSHTKGCAGYKLPDKARWQQEDFSERQVGRGIRTVTHQPHTTHASNSQCTD